MTKLANNTYEKASYAIKLAAVVVIFLFKNVFNLIHFVAE